MGGWVPLDRRSHRGGAYATNAFAIMGKMQFRDDDEFDQGGSRFRPACWISVLED